MHGQQNIKVYYPVLLNIKIKLMYIAHSLCFKANFEHEDGLRWFETCPSIY